ncbi:hypothetical protein FSP39_010859 [Pinctada imbricata]|uniref:C1q domain-containing protein n=1 Tax=Pinctada imbricata TaxID=66713 RepID=A0AA89C8R2_PINIB|nr:hypothetical protein FSP39_010859 [Pinctada imbricata]
MTAIGILFCSLLLLFKSCQSQLTVDSFANLGRQTPPEVAGLAGTRQPVPGEGFAGATRQLPSSALIGSSNAANTALTVSNVPTNAFVGSNLPTNAFAGSNVPTSAFAGSNVQTNPFAGTNVAANNGFSRSNLPNNGFAGANPSHVSELQFLRHLLIEERQSRKALESELDKLKMEILEIKLNSSFQGEQIKQLVIQTDDISRKQAIDSVRKEQMGMQNRMLIPPTRSPTPKNDANLTLKIAALEKNSTAMYSKVQRMSSYFGDMDFDIKQLGQTLVELLQKMGEMESNLTNTDGVLKAYRSQLVTNSLALNYSLVEMDRLKTRVMAISSDGGKKIGFYAFSNNAVPSWRGSDKVKFEKVVSNVGGAYNETTGVFKTPVRGVYVFIWTMTTYEGHSFNSFLVKNGVDVKYLYINGGARGGYETGSTSALLELAPGDQVWIRGGNGGRLDYPNIVFTGFKL